MALRSTQPLTKMSTRNLPGSKKRPALRADNLTAICKPIVYEMWEPQPLATLRASTACTGKTFLVLDLSLKTAAILYKVNVSFSEVGSKYSQV
jgi:hypothetical protein